jgi:competence protein ComEC
LLIETAQQKILLTGDIELEAETRLLSMLPADIDVLLVPHHGSRTSSSQAFLDKLKPKLAIIQSGFNNRYGHPHNDVLERYHNHQINWRNTAETGAIGIWIEADQRRLKIAR